MVAFLVSLFAPGIGHGMVGHPKRGALWAFAFPALWFLATVGAFFSLSAILIGAAASLLLYLGCAIDSARVERRAITKDGWLLLVGAYAATFVAPVCFAICLRIFVVEAFKIPSAGMCPTLDVGDHVFVDKRAYATKPPERGDVVVHSVGDVMFVKRVVGVGGDSIQVDEGRVSVNGEQVPLKPLGEPGCDGLLYEEKLGTAHRIALGIGESAKTYQVPDGELFMLGDNRPNSHDSRQQGSSPVTSVVGRVNVIWLSGGQIAWRDVH